MAENVHIKIRPSKGWVSLRLKDLWEYHELLFFLAWRDIQIRYKQTILGAAWAVIQPFMTMVVFSIFFGKLAKIPSDGIPYPIFAYTALVPWTFFANALSQASNSLLGSSNLIKKVYFPRLIIPISAVMSGILDFAISFLVLIGMMFFYGIVPSPDHLIWIPAFTLLALTSALGVGFWLSAINAEYRDIRHAVPFLIQFWLFATPVAYPASLVQEPWRTIYGLNPMVGVIEGFRWALLGSDSGMQGPLMMSGIVSVTLLVSGAFYFRRMEKNFADLI